ncbi:MAG: hypothetical protein ACI38Q_07100 [Candidatus Bruticola sp.]
MDAESGLAESLIPPKVEKKIKVTSIVHRTVKFLVNADIIVGIVAFSWFCFCLANHEKVPSPALKYCGTAMGISAISFIPLLILLYITELCFNKAKDDKELCKLSAKRSLEIGGTQDELESNYLRSYQELRHFSQNQKVYKNKTNKARSNVTQGYISIGFGILFLLFGRDQEFVALFWIVTGIVLINVYKKKEKSIEKRAAKEEREHNRVHQERVEASRARRLNSEETSADNSRRPERQEVAEANQIEGDFDEQY